MVRVCFVCLGNICRSPTAEAVLRQLVERSGLSAEIEVDSAGTGAWHAGQPPDPRSTAAGRRRGFALGGRARQFVPEDWERFDYVLAMDRSNYDDLAATLPSGAKSGNKLRLLRSFDPASPPGASVPDPYHGTDGFDLVIDQCVAACGPLLEHIKAEHGLGR
jgi:protein-tyrosine phosphatase